MKNFWNEQHTKENILSLSGHPGDTVLKGLYVYEMEFKTVLEVGVGLGKCTRDLVMKGKEVSVVDISEVALSKVRGKVKETYLAPHINNYLVIILIWPFHTALLNI